MRLSGLFLGAGASYELGMPLVWDLTTEIKAWLTPAKLRELNEGWAKQGGGYPTAVIDELASLLANSSMHYESILGHLEVQFIRSSSLRQQYHGLYSWLVELVYRLLYFRQIKNEQYIRAGLRYFEGIAGLADQNLPLWVFSLNHDLMIECLAAEYGLPVYAGFPDSVSLPRRDATGAVVDQLSFELLRGEIFDTQGLCFPESEFSRIHLIKIHGALDVFTYREGRDLIKLYSTQQNMQLITDALRAANEDLIYPAPSVAGGIARITNEIAYADENGVMQFLRRTLLAGSFKFDKRHSHPLPKAFLEQFQLHLNRLSRLICLGYGFGDLHINHIIRLWLEHSGDRRLEIVGPRATVPPFLGHLYSQVQIVDAPASDYLERYARSPLLKSERFNKHVQQTARELIRKKKGFL
jgi:hypothetical protein